MSRRPVCGFGRELIGASLGSSSSSAAGAAAMPPPALIATFADPRRFMGSAACGMAPVSARMPSIHSASFGAASKS
ncbi:hypothetical protein [Lysobacter gummosus]|uniref:hypothetical protein n=1 Tax=Lysobacter gummosus TaxID=262324 RepID=UPI0036267374